MSEIMDECRRLSDRAWDTCGEAFAGSALALVALPFLLIGGLMFDYIVVRLICAVLAIVVVRIAWRTLTAWQDAMADLASFRSRLERERLMRERN